LVLDIMKHNVAWFDKHLRGDATGAGSGAKNTGQ
jgi:hypothetical protein